MKFEEWPNRIDIFFDKIFGLQNNVSIIRRSIIRRYTFVVFIFIVITLGIILKAGITMIFKRPTYQIPKDIKIELFKAIHKGCNFDDAKLIFDNKKRININSIYNNIDVYEPTTDFIDIIDDMIYDYYQQNIIDSSYINQLHLFKKEAKEKYPFDKLNFAQKHLFEKLRENARSSYPSIEKDVIAIASELYDKNEDIDKYLADAENSYILSIIAFYISLIPFILPLWKWFKKILH